MKEKSKKDLTWVVAARVEDEKSLFPEEERLTSEFFERMVEAYDPEFRSAPVVSGYDPDTGVAGPSHGIGEFLAPLGWIDELRFDGLNLWAAVEEIDSRVTRAVTDGFWQRSIGFWTSLSEVDGEPYLRHFALLGGEQPGIPNMPPLTQFFVPQLGEQEARVVNEAPYETRSILDRAEQEEDTDMSVDLASLRIELKEMVKDAVSELAQGLRSAPTGLDDQIKAHIEPLQEAITAVVAESRSVMEDAKKIVGDANAQSRTRDIESAMDRLVRSGRITPAECASELKFLGKLSDEDVKERIEDLGQRSAILPSRLTESFNTDGGPEVQIRTRDFSFPGQNVNPQAMELHREALSRSADSDFNAFRKAAYALHGEECGEVTQ